MGPGQGMNGYADTSFLVSLFTSDSNSPAAHAALIEHPCTLLLTEWHDFELESALRLREFRGLGTPQETNAALHLVQQGVSDGLLRRVQVDHSTTLTRARALASKHGPTLGTRALDVLHVALALELAVDEFFTFDRRQAALRSVVAGRPALPLSASAP